MRTEYIGYYGHEDDFGEDIIDFGSNLVDLRKSLRRKARSFIGCPSRGAYYRISFVTKKGVWMLEKGLFHNQWKVTAGKDPEQFK